MAPGPMAGGGVDWVLVVSPASGALTAPSADSVSASGAALAAGSGLDEGFGSGLATGSSACVRRPAAGTPFSGAGSGDGGSAVLAMPSGALAFLAPPPAPPSSFAPQPRQNL